MANGTTSRHVYRRKSLTPSLIVHIDKSGIVRADTNGFTYRTEVYLQQREKDSVNRTPPGTITTWKNLKNQKQIFDDDQAEIDRVLSTIDSIHGTFNRSLLIPYNQIYSSLFGDDDSIHLMKTFCQKHDHFKNDNNHENTDSDSFITDDDEHEKKKSYDSGYGSVMPRRYLPRI